MEKVFTSSAIFILEENPQNNLQSQLSSSLGSFSGLIGVPIIQSDVDQLIERITERNFILELDKELGFRHDRYFNNYNESLSDPDWKIFLKSLLNWNTIPIDPARKIDWSVVNGFHKNVKITQTEAGAIKVSVKHIDPEKAAEIANHIATKTMLLVKKKMWRHLTRS